MKTYFISRRDGGVSVMRIYSDNTIAEEIAKWHPDDQANIEYYLEGNEEGVPPQDEFRNAWTLNVSEITYDLEKARNLQLDRIRAARQPKLAELDIQYQIADEKEDDAQKKLIAAEKQRLRDITEALKTKELASLDDVKSEFPEELRANIER